VRLAKSAPRSLLVNRFAVLNVEEVNTNLCEPIDTLPPSTLVRTALPWRPKWEKRLPRQLSASTLNACGMSIILPIEIGTTCHKLHSAISSPILRRFPRSQSELKALKKDLLIDTSHVSKRSVLAEILGKSTGNHHGTVY